MESLDGYLARLASESPVPGGGSAAAAVAAMAAALVAMVARICAQSPKYASQSALAQGLVARADTLRFQLERARERDEAAFERVVAAQGLPRSTEAEKAVRASGLAEALKGAAEEPLAIAQSAREILDLAAEALQIHNKNLASDLGCAAEFAHAALAACAYNVRVNHRFMHDDAVIAAQTALLEGYEREAPRILAHVRAAVSALLAR